MAATTVTGTYRLPNGNPDVGTVEFSLIVPSYQDTQDVIVTRTPVTVELDEDGIFTVNLEPTSGADADWIVTGLSYKVIETFLDNRGKKRYSRRYYIDVPTSAVPVDIGIISAWASAPSPFVARFPAGPTSDRPTPELAGEGGTYFDTDLNHPIFSTGAEWVHADGTNL